MNKSKEELMHEAKDLGLDPHPNTGELKLERMINDALEPSDEVEPVKLVKPNELSPAQARGMLRKRQLKLSRIILRSNDARDKDKQGVTIQIICAAGTIKKYIPFDNEAGYHVPQCILDRLLEKKTVQFKNAKLRNGTDVRQSYEGKAYNVEILPDLTVKELKELAADQSARGSIDA